MTIKDLKKGEYFTIKSIECPKDSQVWIRGDYDRSEKRYECYNFSDANRYRYFPGGKTVYTNFAF